MEEKLLKNLLRDPEKGLERIMDEYLSLVYAVVRRKSEDQISNDLIEDIVSDAFLALYEKRKDIDLNKSSLKNYLCLIASRKTIDCLRKESNKKTYLEKQKSEILNNNQTEDIIESEYLKQCLKKLGITERRILLMKYSYGHKSEIIAKKLNLKPNTVDKKASRSLEKLRKLMGVTYG